MSIILKQFTVGALETNNYLIMDEFQKEAALIDCTENSQQIHDELAKQGTNLKYILLTHGHFDHILGVNDFKKKYDCQVLVHESDMDLINNIDRFMSMIGYGTGEIQEIDGFLKHNEKIKLGDSEITILHTPGHTQGSVGFYVDEMYFSGDTIFKGCVGRTDLPGGDFNQLKKSIHNNIFVLNDETEIYPGHGPKTTVKYEIDNNQFL